MTISAAADLSFRSLIDRSIARRETSARSSGCRPRRSSSGGQHRGLQSTDDQGWPQLCGRPPGLGLDGPEHGGMLASKVGALKRYTATRRIKLYPVGAAPRTKVPPATCEGMGLQGGWDPSTTRRIAAPFRTDHTSTLETVYSFRPLAAPLFTLESRAFRYETDLEIAPKRYQ